jgi:hypothetical protein
MKNYLGRKIRGFKFEDDTDDIRWNEDMVHYLGKVGNVIKQGIVFVTVKFDCETWTYPISLIEQHLVQEEPEISGLEALFIVHGGWYGKEQEILYNKCIKIIKEEGQRLQSIYINNKPKYTHAELVEKLGEDFIYEK